MKSQVQPASKMINNNYNNIVRDTAGMRQFTTIKLFSAQKMIYGQSQTVVALHDG
jgi:hypothetical protein